MAHARFDFSCAAKGCKIAAGLLRDESYTPPEGMAVPDRARMAQKIEKGVTPQSEAYKNIVKPLFADYVARTDPTAGKQYRYLLFVTDVYLNEKPLAEDFYKLKGDLHDLSVWGAQLSADKKPSGIEGYKNWKTLETTLHPYQQKRDKKKEATEKHKLGGEALNKIMRQTTVFYDGPLGKVVMPHTMKASQYWGGHTKWCISARKAEDNAFDKYNGSGPILICLPRVSPQVKKDNPKKSSFKYAFVQNEMWNERDEREAAAPAFLQPLLDAAQKKLPENVARRIETLTQIKKERDVKQKILPPDPSWPEEKQKMFLSAQRDALALVYGDKVWRKDRDILLAAGRCTSTALLYADDALRADPKFVLEMLHEDVGAIQHADKALRADRDFMLRAVKISGYALHYADDALRADREIVLAAVKNKGSALSSADETLWADREIALEAAKRDMWALRYIDDSLCADHGFMLEVVKVNGAALSFADKSLCANFEIAGTAVKQNGAVLQVVDRKRRRDKAFMQGILETAPWACLQMAEKDMVWLEKTFGADAILRNIVPAAVAWDRAHPAQTQDNPALKCLQLIPALWGDPAALSDPAVAAEKMAAHPHAVSRRGMSTKLSISSTALPA